MRTLMLLIGRPCWRCRPAVRWHRRIISTKESHRGALLFSIVLLVTSGIAQGEEKTVTVCHRPPGNATNSQTITVGESAIQAHLNHGDDLGACPTGCQRDPMQCDDGNLCTSDSCQTNGQCANVPVNCDDDNPCTEDSCVDGCRNVPAGDVPCDDGNACTGPDVCEGRSCEGTPIAGCCTGDAACDDSENCTEDACIAGRCSNEERDCSVSDMCLAGFCDPSDGTCGTVPVVTPPEDPEVSCDDGVDNDCDGTVDDADANCTTCDCPGCTYVANDPEECGFIRFSCPDASEPFFNACGCGCQTGGPLCAGLCGAGEFCCNDSCNICAPLGGTCPVVVCN